ncbi:hypothetical protein H920_11532 [Fukomys damarensis]|uniref:Uncharacterized protein n=1 Tax=Fukomys damarensis TaxID=885580 RepID=A0A091DWE5_FUKDA|nr:hypothetical protein H920_11532 [Fukomys damarensis]
MKHRAWELRVHTVSLPVLLLDGSPCPLFLLLDPLSRLMAQQAPWPGLAAATAGGPKAEEDSLPLSGGSEPGQQRHQIPVAAGGHPGSDTFISPHGASEALLQSHQGPGPARRCLVQSVPAGLFHTVQISQLQTHSEHSSDTAIGRRAATAHWAHGS